MAWNPVYSTRFFAGLLQAPADNAVLRWQCPVGKIGVVKSADMFVSTPGDSFIIIEVGGVFIQFLSMSGTPTFRTATWRGSIVLYPGDSVHTQFYGGVTNVNCSGFVFNNQA